jgi:hypothetical protein
VDVKAKEGRTKRRKDARKERDGGKTEMKEKSTAGTGCPPLPKPNPVLGHF